MVTIRVFGTTPPCANCKRAEREARKAARQFPGQIEVVKLGALGPEAEPYGLMVTPTVVIDDEIIGTGKVVPADRLADYIRGVLGG